METVSCISVPHVGEGVRHVMVNRILKRVGEWVDEEVNIAEIETDKAILEVPSSRSGYVTRWLCREGEKLEIGAPFMEISSENTSRPAPDQQMRRRDRGSVVSSSSDKQGERLPEAQIRLAQAMVKSMEIIPQANLGKIIDWKRIDDLKKIYRATDWATPSALAILSWACANAIRKYDKFSSGLSRELVLTRSAKVRIGIAKSGPDDHLTTPSLAFDEMDDLQDVQRKLIALGNNTEAHSFAISDMSPFGITSAIPVVVYPSVATLVIGSPYKEGDKKLSHLSLSFDHRLINGVYAAKFLKEVDDQIDNLVRKTLCKVH